MLEKSESEVDQVRERYGKYQVQGEDIKVDVVQLFRSLEGSKKVSVQVIQAALLETGVKIDLNDAINIIAQGMELFNIQWSRTGGYEVGQEYDKPPVHFRGINLQRERVPADNADCFQRLNPEWIRLSFFEES